MLSYENITLILTVAELNNMSRAARTLYISQSSLSKRIQEIEKYLGYQIFTRKPGQKNLEITRKGMKLIPILSEIKQLDKSAKNIRDTVEKKRLSIASSDGPYIMVIDDAVQELLEQSQEWVLKLKSMSYQECADAVSRNIVDIAFIGQHIYRKNLDMIPLYREKMVFVCMPGEEVPEVVEPRSLDPTKGIYSPYSSELSIWFRSTFSQRCLIQCDLIPQVKKYLRRLNLWSIVPSSVAAYLSKDMDMIIRPLSEDVPHRIIYQAVRHGNECEEISELMRIIRRRLANRAGIDVYPEGSFR